MSYSKTGIPANPSVYHDFQGIDDSRDRAAMESGDKQHLVTLNNGYCDWRGIVIRDRAAEKQDSNGIIQHVVFFGRGLAAFARKDGGGITLSSVRGHDKTEIYPRDATVSSTFFNGQIVFASRDQKIQQYNGLRWTENRSATNPGPAYLAAVQGRLAMAGFSAFPTEVWFSRVDDEHVSPDDEAADANQVTKAARIDIRNVLGTADQIKGLALYENSRLAIFTLDRTLIYNISADYTQWAIDENSNIWQGLLSHNAVAHANNDLIYPSRGGVQTLKRSVQNGVTSVTLPMSVKIERLYQQLVRKMAGREDEVSGYFDPDRNQYHMFFPHTDAICTRLTLTLGPEGVAPKWSTGDFLNARCGANLGGVSMIGTTGGVYRLANEEEAEDDLIAPTLDFTTPILWMGTLTDPKESTSFILQASGTGTVRVEAFDEEGRELSAMDFDVERGGTEDDSFLDVPLTSQYDRKFEHRFRGVQFRFTASGTGLLKITGFAVLIRQEPRSR